MADAKQIQIQNKKYWIKDKVARKILARVIGNSDNESAIITSELDDITVNNINSVAKQISDLNTDLSAKINTLTASTNSSISDLNANIDEHIANTSNPHEVTKEQVGLGNVANYDQSKAIISISRSDTTFTATAIDGTTTIFDQQDTVYTHPTESGYKHIPSGGSSGEILKWDSDGTAAWGTYDVATTSADGLMSKEDKTILDGLNGITFEIV